MRLIQLFLPVYDKQRVLFGKELFAQVRLGLTEILIRSSRVKRI